jgi:hypothetical protein
MTRRANPLHAFVDLFAALLIAGFGGFIMLAGAYQQELPFSEDAAQKIKDMRNQLASYQEAEDKVKKLRQECDRIFEQVLQSLSQNSCFQRLRVGAAKLSNRSHRPRRFATLSWLRPREAGL